MEEAARYSLAAGVGAELGRIGGCQTCLDAPAGATGFLRARLARCHAQQSLGPGPQPQSPHRASTLEQRALLTYFWPRFHSLDRFNLSFTAFTIIRATCARSPPSARKARCSFPSASPRRARCSTASVSPRQRERPQDLAVPVNQLSQPVRVGILSLAYINDRRDDPVDPHKGIYTTIDVGIADHIFGSQRRLFRFLARNATYYPLGKKLVLARSTQIGDIYSFNYRGDPANAIPLPERFFGGGGTSHRGFPRKPGGPRDTDTGFPLGGTFLLFNRPKCAFPWSATTSPV